MANKPLPPVDPIPMPIRAIWKMRGYLAWWLHDRWVLKAAGFKKGPDGWWLAPDHPAKGRGDYRR
jgi:hypothetical protein